MLNKPSAHPLALELLQDDFYWDTRDANSPFGAVEGHQALQNYQKWKGTKLEDLLAQILEKQGKVSLNNYNKQLLNRNKIQQQIADRKFDDFRFILQLDGSIIATVLAHFIKTGKLEAIPIFEIAIERLILWNEYQEDFNSVCEQQIIQLYSMKQLIITYQRKMN